MKKVVILFLVVGNINAQSIQKADDIYNRARELYSSNLDSSLFLTNQSLKLYQELNDESKIARSHHLLGAILYIKDSLRYSLEHYMAAMDINERLGVNNKILIENVGHIFFKVKHYQKAIEYYTKAIGKSEKDDIDFIVKVHKQIGSTYQEMGRFVESLNHYKQALKLKDTTNLSNELGALYNELGIVHKDLGNYHEALRFYDSSLKVKQALSDTLGFAYTYHNAGKVYELQGYIDKATELYKLALDIKIKFNSKTTHSSLNNLGKIFIQSNQLDSALVYLERAEQIKYGSLAKEPLKTTCNLLAELWSLKGDQMAQFKYITLHTKVSNELAEAQKVSELLRQEQLHDLVKIEQDFLALRNQVNQNKLKISLLTVIVTLIAIALISFFVYFKYLQKKAKLNYIGDQTKHVAKMAVKMQEPLEKLDEINSKKVNYQDTHPEDPEEKKRFLRKLVDALNQIIKVN
ncbi:tetratricopeptide repeat protein [Fulvivirgaceae bacterium BMA10]|uniref:Tetratricopeptide repeat protein n=1 Tax=Splendidivirga corallicola TaxID=3051826 RepID=A0ABT8KGT1_9BACT|nr:tetratricopeptide repeat protein [Fulvivirgaceae bacterium BMA10]